MKNFELFRLYSINSYCIFMNCTLGFFELSRPPEVVVGRGGVLSPLVLFLGCGIEKKTYRYTPLIVNMAQVRLEGIDPWFIHPSILICFTFSILVSLKKNCLKQTNIFMTDKITSWVTSNYYFMFFLFH